LLLLLLLRRGLTHLLRLLEPAAERTAVRPCHARLL
jgi:hypothetical protein